MPIEIEGREVYGRRLFYVRGERARLALSRLTGKCTLDENDVEALRWLGLDVQYVPT